MLSELEQVERAARARRAYFALGLEIVDASLATMIVGRDVPRVYDANLALDVTARTDDEIDEFLATSDEVFSHCEHRQVLADPATPARLACRLALADYRCDRWVELQLTGPLRFEAPTVPIRPVSNDDDWASLTRLMRADHVEAATKGHLGALPVDVTTQLVEAKRRKAPDVQFFLAGHDGVDVAFMASFAGVDGGGIVEDLFCHWDHRRRGIASALVAHTVADARARGAADVLIAADTEDWPKGFYHRAGFEPLCVGEAWLLGGD